jgi:hypothetical protein
MRKLSLDAINIGLMIIAATIAFFIPFELFLFSYAFLGPLHYLTEIIWLQEKNYFTQLKSTFIWPLISVVCVLLIMYCTHLEKSLSFLGALIFTSFLISFCIVTVKQKITQLILLSVIVISILLLANSPQFLVLVAVLLPTVIHVFFFTACFMLNGALKGKSRSGVAAVLVFVACCLVLIFAPANSISLVSSVIQSTYSSFEGVNQILIGLFTGNHVALKDAIYASAVGISCMRFLAFVYTYHYLNWFSKTKIIRWHLIPRPLFILVVVLALLAIGIYLYNYRIGFIALYFLSLLHVLLEFPLNQVTLLSIGKELRGRFKQRPAVNSISA